MPDVVMPRLSESMEEGTILRWLRASGDEVKRGDQLAEIETDKATVTFEAAEDGVFEPVAGEGETLPIGAVIARIGEVAAGNGAPSAAAERGTVKGDVTIEELTRAQQVVARRMAESKATVPEFTLRTEVDMERCVQLRADLQSAEAAVPTFNDLVVKATALALKAFPRANGAYRDGRFELYSRVNVGIAVAAQDALVFPTIFDADQRDLGSIAQEARRLAERAREGTITPPELSGATFTVSNLGMYGITEFAAVINPPQAAVLAVGAIEPRPVVHEGAIAARHRMALTLACDHRILYGAVAAEFLARIRALLEAPLPLAL